ncbi:MAG: S8 family peptidase [Oligoflexia bacterium]|nr:S8 family peptidase [Oligoflexia bacterium]
MKSLLICISLLAASNATAGEFIIKFKNPINQKSLLSLKTLNANFKSTIPKLNMVVVTSDTLKSGVVPKALENEIEYIAKNGKIYLDSAKGDAWQNEASMLWGMEAVKLKKAWNITKGDKSVVVAVSDTGTYLNHSDLSGNLWINKGESGLDANGKDKAKNKKDDDGNGYVDDVYGYNFETNTSTPNENHYHGTHVAGTVGGVGGNGGIVGVAGKVSLMTVKFISASGEGTDEAAINTIVYASDNGARAINCSWGSDEYSEPLYDAIVYAQKKGVLIIAAAGNDGHNHDKYEHYPSGYDLDNIITVAATTSSNGLLAGFSNYGVETVDLAAPGERIRSSFNVMYNTLYCGTSGMSHFYCELSGTSMAAPHVTGAVAMVYAVNPKLTYKEAKAIILSTVAPSKHLKGKVITGGQLDVNAAVIKAKATLN